MRLQPIISKEVADSRQAKCNAVPIGTTLKFLLKWLSREPFRAESFGTG